MEKIKPSFTEEQLGKNQFVDQLQIRVNYQEIKTEVVPFEHEPYCKVFVSSEKRKVMAKLSAGAKELLMWLMYEADKGKDYVWLNRKRYMAECGVKSPTTVSLAVKELLTDFISTTKVREIYFINPAYFFHGSRINKFPERIRDFQSKAHKPKDESYDQLKSLEGLGLDKPLEFE